MNIMHRTAAHHWVSRLFALVALAFFAGELRAQSRDLEPCDHEGKALDLCSHAHAALLREAHDFTLPTRSAAQREADSATDVTHYLLDIDLYPQVLGSFVTGVEIFGQCTIDVTSQTNGLNEFTIDLLSNMTVNSVTGSVASWSRVSDTIVVTLDQNYDAGMSFQVTVDYEGQPQSGGFGAFSAWKRGSNIAMATLSEPFFARYWWPCKDSLGDKSTMQMHVTVEDGMVVASNGVDEGSVSVGGGRTKFMWHETNPMAAYLASLAITNYERYDLTFSYDNGSGPESMPVVAYLYPDHWDTGAGEPFAAYKTGCDEMPVMLETLSDAYGLYPFFDEKYGVAETGGGLSANMEHQTISSMYRVDNYTDIMMHEMAHHWWGDNVTCGTWYDIWLNEGFATFSEALYQLKRPGGGDSAYWTRMLQRRPFDPNEQVYRTSISSVSSIFSGNGVYNKGAWVLHMLFGMIGEDAFLDALTDYRAAYEGGFAVTADFTAILSGSFGEDLAWFIDQWVMSPGSPRYRWDYATEMVNGQNYLKLKVEQVQDSAGYGLFTMPVPIRVTTTASVSTVKVWNDGWSEYFVIPVDGVVTQVEFDEDGGVSNHNWVLAESVLQSGGVTPPPALVEYEWIPFDGGVATSTVLLRFSEDIGGIAPSAIAMVGASSGSHVPTLVDYSGAARTATVTFTNLPHDDYTFRVIASEVFANAKMLDGEIDDSAWYDDQLLPSGDGEPGGDAILLLARHFGDFDDDGDVDHADAVGCVGCLTGPTGPAVSGPCAQCDFDVDTDVDLRDFAKFVSAIEQ